VNLGYPVFIEAKDDGSGGDYWTNGAISHAKLQPNHHHQQTNIQFFYRSDVLPVAQPTVPVCIVLRGTMLLFLVLNITK